MRAVLAFAFVTVLGAAFIHRGYDQREAQQQLAAGERADAVASALERQMRGALAAAQAAPGSTSGVDAIDRDDWQDVLRSSAAWVGPVRGAGGARQMVARVPGDPAPEARFRLVDFDALLESASLPRLPQAGFAYRLSRTGEPRAAPLAQSTGAAFENAAVREIPGAQWTLAVAPMGSATALSSVLLQGLIVLLLAWAAALATREATHERELLKATVAASLALQRDATNRLAAEIAQREELEKQFGHASFHDATTGLPTRRFLVSCLEAALRERRTAGGHVAVAIVEAAGVRAISDSFGIAVGDELLVQIARGIEGAAASPGLHPGRLTDAEFAVVMAALPSREAALDAVRAVELALRKPFSVAGHTLHVRVHAGIAYSTTGYEHPDDLLRGAHIALAHARREQLASVVFDPTTEEQLVSRQQLEASLHGVAERGELRANYQPIVDLASGKLVGFEALVRWQHPVEGLVPPNVFIGLAEESGLILPITRWMLHEACTQAQAWRSAHAGRDFYVSVNLSARDMRQADLPEYVERVLQETGLAASHLRLEVTEGSMIDNVREAVDLITRLRQLGIRILLDDFGTGYSSLSYLHRFPIDYLKIDQSFVRRMSPGDKSSGIVRAILYLAEAMGIQTVAEGIETAEARELLLALRCDYGQGYLFSRPVDAAAAGAFLANAPSWEARGASRPGALLEQAT